MDIIFAKSHAISSVPFFDAGSPMLASLSACESGVSERGPPDNGDEAGARVEKRLWSPSDTADEGVSCQREGGR